MPADTLEHADPFSVFGAVPATSDPTAARLLARALKAPVGARRQALLARVDGRQLDGGDRVSLMVAWQECVSWVTAHAELSVALVAGPPPEPPSSSEPTSVPSGNIAEDAVCATVGAALHVTPYAAMGRVAAARAAAGEVGPGHLSFVGRAVVALHLWHAGDAVNGTRPVWRSKPWPLRARQPGVKWTPARLKRRIRRELVRLDSEAVSKRVRARRHQRSARLDPTDDLHGIITVDGSWDTIAWAFGQFRRWAEQERGRLRDIRLHDPAARFCCPEAMAHLLHHAAARSSESPGDPEGAHPGPDIGRRCADDSGLRPGDDCSFCGAPDTGVPSLSALTADAVVAAAGLLASRLGDQSADLAPQRGRRWRYAAIMVDLPTLLGLADDPGYVPGYGDVPAPIARELAADATQWRRFLIDRSGVLLNAGARTYRPGDRLREHITARDWTCTFLGCARCAADADLDHMENFDGSNTTAENLHPLCRTHHRIKTHAGWNPSRRPDGSTLWTSPTGHEYVHQPETPGARAPWRSLPGGARIAVRRLSTMSRRAPEFASPGCSASQHLLVAHARESRRTPTRQPACRSRYGTRPRPVASHDVFICHYLSRRAVHHEGLTAKGPRSSGG